MVGLAVGVGLGVTVGTVGVGATVGVEVGRSAAMIVICWPGCRVIGESAVPASIGLAMEPMKNATKAMTAYRSERVMKSPPIVDNFA
jgi:hypothetical protein